MKTMKNVKNTKILLVVVILGLLVAPSCHKRYLDFDGKFGGVRIELDITDFGAIGDGITDDTDAVVAAFDTINAHPENRYLLRFPEGTYSINAEVTADSVKIVGDGLLIPVSGSTDVVLKINGNHNVVKGLSFNEKTFCHVLLDVSGDYNTVDGCFFDRDSPVTGTSVYYSDKFLYLSKIEGIGNLIKNCKINNGRTGIGLRGSCKVLSSEISNCITGIMAHASTNNTEIAHNIIRDNNINHASGADGILGQRNVTKVHIHNNEISNSGEHGVYFQGDSSVIENNNVFNNYGSGIKLASYNTGLYNYPDSLYYIGHGNLIKNNVCYDNATSGGTNAGIYLQAPLIDIVVEDNECYGNYHGIRSTSVASISESDPDYDKKTTLRQLLFINNQAYNNVGRSMNIEGEKNIIIENNEVDNILTNAKSTSHKIDSTVINGNKINDVLIINRASNCFITHNEIEELRVSSNSMSTPHVIQWNILGATNVAVDSTNTIL